MPKACMYFEVTDLMARCQQFHERLKLEHGLSEKPSLPLHVTIKRSFEVPAIILPRLRDRIQGFVRQQHIAPIHAKILAASTFDIDGSDKKVLHLPIEGEHIDRALQLLLDLCEEEFSLPRSGFEGESPHVTLMYELPEREVLGVLGLARSFAWPESLILRSISLDSKSDAQARWRPWVSIPLPA